jgi:hypothetical protein
MLLLGWSLTGCGGSASAPQGLDYLAFVGASGRLMELRAPSPAGDTGDTGALDTAALAGPSRWLRIGESDWVLSEGDDVDTAAAVSSWPILLDKGLFVDGTPLLPPRVAAGATLDGATITEVAEWTTRYGTFPTAAHVAVEAGPFAGDHAFAEDVGPIHLTIDGQAWELVWYE